MSPYVLPANNDRWPPSSVLPSPTLIVISPPFPPDADPVPIDIDPDDPDDDVPVLNVSSPLTPVVPAFNVRRKILPLDRILLYPLRIDIDPPVESVLPYAVPANSVIWPAFLFPCASPTSSFISPLLPIVFSPDAMNMSPLVAFTVVSDVFKLSVAPTARDPKALPSAPGSPILFHYSRVNYILASDLNRSVLTLVTLIAFVSLLSRW